MGQIGGYTALIWVVLRFLFDGYESFRFDNALIGSVYSLTPEGPDGAARKTEAESQKALHQTLSGTQADSVYSYVEFTLARLLKSVFCCCSGGSSCSPRMRRYELWLAAQGRLSRELSLMNVLSSMRLASFLGDLMSVKNYQRVLINKAKKYQVQQLRPSDKVEDGSLTDPTAEDQLEGLAPSGNGQTKLNASYFEESLLEPD